MMTEWPRGSLGQLLRLERRPVEVRPDKQYQEIGIYCFGRGIFHKPPRTGFEVGDKKLFLLKKGDFILQVTFAWEGAVAIVSAAEDGFYGSTRYPTFQVDETRCVPQFLLQYFKTEEGIQQLVKICPGSAGRNRVLSIKRIPEVLVPLPPLAEQQRVVARIDELARKVDEAHCLKKETLEATGAMLISAWRQVLGSAGNGLRSLPIEECCETIIDYRGRTPPVTDTGIPHVTSRSIKNGKIDWHVSRFVTEETYQNYMTRGIPKAGDVIFTMEAPLGEAAVVPDKRRFSLAQRILLLRNKRDVVSSDFLAKIIMSPQVREKIYAHSTGTTVKGIASKRLKKIPLPIPTLDEQRRIVAYLDDLQKEAAALKTLQAETSAELDALMPSILDKAFRGEL